MNKFEQIKDIKQRRLAFLEDTASFYNSKNRATEEDGFCIYRKTKTSPGCAIGRWVPELSKRSGAVDFFRHLLPEWMIEMGMGFLTAIQKLHDEERNWNDTGLSKIGKEKFNEIKLEWT